MSSATITGVKVVPSPVAARAIKGERDAIVTYTTDGKNSFFVVIPTADPTAEQIKAAITEEMKVQQHVGKIISF